jgi:HTH-type transcriptional regulator, competence development regulator
VSKESTGQKLRQMRQNARLPLRKVAAELDMDVAILSKLERGERNLTREIVEKLAAIYGADARELTLHLLSEKVLEEIGNEEYASDVLQLAESRLSYPTRTKTFNALCDDIKDVLKQDGRVTSAWIFGSHARGEARADSDLDIMVELKDDQEYSLFDLADVAHRIALRIGRTVDLVEKGQLRPFAHETATRDWIKIYG